MPDIPGSLDRVGDHPIAGVPDLTPGHIDLVCVALVSGRQGEMLTVRAALDQVALLIRVSREMHVVADDCRHRLSRAERQGSRAKIATSRPRDCVRLTAVVKIHPLRVIFSKKLIIKLM